MASLKKTTATPAAATQNRLDLKNESIFSFMLAPQIKRRAGAYRVLGQTHYTRPRMGFRMNVSRTS